MYDAIPIEEFRVMILRSYFLDPCGINDSGFSYVQINKEIFNKLTKSSAFTESQLKGLESRITD